MLRNPGASLAFEAISAAAALDAETHDRDGQFPAAAFEALHALGVTAQPPLRPGDAEALLWMLAAAGHGDLSVGRILEGHVNVLWLIERHGTDDQKHRFAALARQGALFGVWNTDAPNDPLSASHGILEGSKSFSTGIDGLSHAVVTASSGGSRQMIIVPLQDVTVDRSWWRPMGMRASGSHIVSFTGLRTDAAGLLGGPDAYIEQPWFSAGAMRFAAVQVGGMHAILDVAVAHLRRAGRDGDAHQRHRIGDMAATVATGYGWIRRCADSWTRAERGERDAAAEVMCTVNGARGAIERGCLLVLELAERSVGAAGLIAPHPLERRVRDLRTYLRQPNPDGALESFGESVLSGRWSPATRPCDPGP